MRNVNSIERIELDENLRDFKNKVIIKKKNQNTEDNFYNIIKPIYDKMLNENNLYSENSDSPLNNLFKK
jgi:hypothetical protein